MTAEEWGVQREDGTVAGPMWKTEALDLAPKWGRSVVVRTVIYGPWTPYDAPLNGGSGVSDE